MTYGRPLGINDTDCDVTMPADVYETWCFASSAQDHDQSPICYSTYQRELNKLYITASPMIKIVFGTGSSSSTDQAAGDRYSHMMKRISWN
jgi:hypothetical protein